MLVIILLHSWDNSKLPPIILVILNKGRLTCEPGPRS
jgi:hypothetical protein